MLISLCHATFKSKKEPKEIRDIWLKNALNKDNIEYIPGLNEDDYLSLSNTEGIKRYISKKSTKCTAVKNWNGAAYLSKGDLIFVIADDLEPCYGWDIKLKEVAMGLNPNKYAFAIKIGDSQSDNDKKMRHPIISRKFYEKFGLFDKRFRGVFCDDDITKRAFWKAIILDGRDIKLIHSHHTNSNNKNDIPISTKLINTEEEYEYGFSVIQKIWRHHKLISPIFLLKKKSKILPASFFVKIVFFLRFVSNLLVILNFKAVYKAIITKISNFLTK